MCVKEPSRSDAALAGRTGPVCIDRPARHVRLTRAARQGLALALALVLGAVWLGSCDDAVAPEPPKQENAPPETFLVVTGDSLEPQLYRLQLSWLGTDADGRVTAYRHRWTCPPENPACPIDTTWMETSALSELFSLPAPEGSARYIFEVAAVDDDGAVDPAPARQVFDLVNNRPEVEFEPMTLPVRSLPAVTFYLTATDPDTTRTESDKDSRAYLDHYRAWLDGAEAAAKDYPIEDDVVVLREGDFGGRYGMRTVFVQAVDDGGAASEAIQHTWDVEPAPENGILLVDDCRMGGFLENASDQSYRNVLAASAPGRYVILDIETIPRLSSGDLEATVELFDNVVWYTDADTTSSGALELARNGLDSLLSRSGRLFLSSGLVFGTRSAFGDHEPRFRELFGIETVFRSPNGSTNFSLDLADTVQALVHPGLTEFHFLSQGLRAIMECFRSRQDASTLYVYPESTFVRAFRDSNFVNPEPFEIGVHHLTGGAAHATYVSFPIGLPINNNMGENETEIRELLKLTQILDAPQDLRRSGGAAGGRHFLPDPGLLRPRRSRLEQRP